MEVWAWSLWDGEDDPYGDHRSVCSANLEGESRVFASREEAEVHLRRWLSAEIRRGPYGDALNKRSVQAVIDNAILNGKAEYDRGFRVFSDVTIYALWV